jgi:plasmid replication initiation protein
MGMKESLFRNKLIATDVYESSTLLHSRYSMSKDEGRIILMCMERMKRDDEINKTGEYWFSVTDYCDVFNISRSEALKDIKASIDKLSDRWIHIKKGDEEVSLRWIGKKMRNVKLGRYGVVFWPEILPYIHDLTDQLTVPLRWLAEMNNDINQRFLRWVNESIKNNETELVMSLDDIRYGLDIRESSSYKIYNNLKRRIIEPAILNIKSATGLLIEFTEIKESRKVVKIKIKWENPEILQNTPHNHG